MNANTQYKHNYVNKKYIKTWNSHIPLVSSFFGTSKNASPRVDKIGVGRIRNINKYEYLFGQKRINAENVYFNFIIISFYYYLWISSNFFGGLGEDRIVFKKNVFSVLLNKRKKRYFQADRSSKSRLFEQAQYRNENDTHNPIKIIDITDNQINGRLDND